MRRTVVLSFEAGVMRSVIRHSDTLPISFGSGRVLRTVAAAAKRVMVRSVVFCSA